MRRGASWAPGESGTPIEAALRETVRRGRMSELRRSLGGFDPKMAPEELARLRGGR